LPNSLKISSVSSGTLQLFPKRKKSARGFAVSAELVEDRLQKLSPCANNIQTMKFYTAQIHHHHHAHFKNRAG
jgi:hypothetical protein